MFAILQTRPEQNRVSTTSSHRVSVFIVSCGDWLNHMATIFMVAVLILVLIVFSNLLTVTSVRNVGQTHQRVSGSVICTMGNSLRRALSEVTGWSWVD